MNGEYLLIEKNFFAQIQNLDFYVICWLILIQKFQKMKKSRCVYISFGTKSKICLINQSVTYICSYLFPLFFFLASYICYLKVKNMFSYKLYNFIAYLLYNIHTVYTGDHEKVKKIQDLKMID